MNNNLNNLDTDCFQQLWCFEFSCYECHGVHTGHRHKDPSTPWWNRWCFYWFHTAGLSCLLSSHLVMSAAAVPEDGVSAAGTKPGSVLWRVSAKRQPDWKCNRRRDLSGEEILTPSLLLFTSERRMWEFVAFDFEDGESGAALSLRPGGSAVGLHFSNAVIFFSLFSPEWLKKNAHCTATVILP